MFILFIVQVETEESKINSEFWDIKIWNTKKFIY